MAGAPGRTMGRQTQQRLTTTASYIILGVGAIVMLVPFFWMVSTSLKSIGEVFVFPPKLIGSDVVWQNYEEVLAKTPFPRMLWNTVFITAFTVGGTLLTSAMAGFAFSKNFNYRGKTFLFVMFLLAIMIPYHVLLVPTFALLKGMGLLDTPWALILPAVVAPFGIFLMRQFFLGIPMELAEAARLDGCSPWGVFWYIFLPLSKPALAALGILTFVASWNDFLRPLIFLSSNEQMTLTLGIFTMQGMFATNWPLLMATVVLTLLPVVVVFLLVQDLFVKGIAHTGIK